MRPAARRRSARRTRRRSRPTSIFCARWHHPTRRRSASSSCCATSGPGRVGMILEVGMEYAHLFHDDPELAREVGRGAGPRRAGRPPGQPLLPALCDPEELEAAGRSLGAAEVPRLERAAPGGRAKAQALETSSLSVLYSPEFDRHFRADLLAVARATRPIAFEERPFSHPWHRGLHHRRRPHDQGADRRAWDSRRAGDNAACARPATDKHGNLVDRLHPTPTRTDRCPIEGREGERGEKEQMRSRRRAGRSRPWRSVRSSWVRQGRCQAATDTRPDAPE